MDKDELITTIQQDAAVLLNDSAIKTPDKAKQVANMLLQQGIQPTWRLIREILGTGSATTLQNVVNNYWAELGKRLNHLEKRADIPNGLAKEFNKLWDKALKQAQAEIEERLKSDFAEAKAVKDDIQKQLTQLDAELEQVQTEKIQQEKKYIEESRNHKITLQQLSTQLEQQRQETKQLQKLHQQTKTMGQHYQQQASDLSIALETLKQEYQQATEQLRNEQLNVVERQAQQYESMIDHYANELGQLKIANEERDKQYQKERGEWQRKQEDITNKLANLQIDNAILKQENQQLKQIESKLQQSVISQQSTLLSLEKSQSVLQTRCLFYEERSTLLKEQLEDYKNLKKDKQTST
ncbi:MAG TPA: DNA-binding protein [Thiothrix sp.]|nr:DNA-binding protein [Thiothrix sp.]